MSRGCFVDGCKNSPQGECRICGRKACSAHGAMRGQFFYCRLHKKRLPMGFAGGGDPCDDVKIARAFLAARSANLKSEPALRQIDEFLSIAEGPRIRSSAAGAKIADCIVEAARLYSEARFDEASALAEGALLHADHGEATTDPYVHAFKALAAIVLGDIAEEKGRIDCSNDVLRCAFEAVTAAIRLALAHRLGKAEEN